MRRLAVLGQVVVLAIALLAVTASAKVSCGSIEVRGEPLDVTITSGHVSCKEARQTMHTFLSGPNTEAP
ncbi:MAG TPA: hypothetical protein VH081_05375, partial [Solirubrobacteraceae bacterium]|nr:hypothetical protein [Solirubrobacteraceae bacterium]